MLKTLYIEISSDPLTRGYAAMTDEQIAESLNQENRQSRRDAMSTAEIFDTFDINEFQTLDNADRTLVRDLLALGESVRIGENASVRRLLINAFGTNSQTIQNLQQLTISSISRADEIGLGRNVNAGMVIKARRWGEDNAE